MGLQAVLWRVGWRVMILTQFRSAARIVSSLHINELQRKGKEHILRPGHTYLRFHIWPEKGNVHVQPNLASCKSGSHPNFISQANIRASQMPNREA